MSMSFLVLVYICMYSNFRLVMANLSVGQQMHEDVVPSVFITGLTIRSRAIICEFRPEQLFSTPAHPPLGA